MQHKIREWVEEHPILTKIIFVLVCMCLLYNLGYGIGKFIGHIVT